MAAGLSNLLPVRRCRNRTTGDVNTVVRIHRSSEHEALQEGVYTRERLQDFAGEAGWLMEHFMHEPAGTEQGDQKPCGVVVMR